jgi:coenzyme Q-binding protein COQ10
VPKIAETRNLPWSAEQMFDLVADVKRYPEFLPWVVATRIRSDNADEMVADMMVGFNVINEKFTSRVRKLRAEQIAVEYVDGPLKNLRNIWQFTPDGPNACVIDFSVDFSFRNIIFEKLAGQYLDRAFRKMVTAFEARAQKLYGSSNSSATTAA